MDEHAAAPERIDQPGGNDAAQNEDERDGHGAEGCPVTVEIERLQHSGREGIDREDRDNRAGPERGDEEHALAIAGMQEAQEGQFFLLALFRQIFQ
ncbi:hypothetical protein D3C85_1163240 [compost metagenome]